MSLAVLMILPLSYIAPADADASIAGDGPWAATIFVFGDHASTK